jgi:hypothetical protein
MVPSQKINDLIDDELWPLFSALQVRGTYGKRGTLRADSSSTDLNRLCQLGLISDSTDSDQHRDYEMTVLRLKYGGTLGLSHDEMSFKLGKVILKNSGNEMSVNTTAEKLDDCIKDMARQQRTWLR